MRLKHAVISAFMVGAIVAVRPVLAHQERDIDSQIRPGPVPRIDRVNPNHLVVCKPDSQPTAAQLADITSRNVR